MVATRYFCQKLFLLYRFLKIYVRFVIRFYCHSIRVNKPELLKTRGPLLIASNHPNSFLDAMIYDILFDTPIWSLARGDVFKRFPKAIPFLSAVKIFPIYRTREGVQNLSENYETFDACMQVFKKGEAVTIFSEALCVNEWRLRPLKKGTARIAFMAWEKNLPVQVLPAGINYSSFRRYGKQIDVNFGNLMQSSDFNLSDTDGNKHLAFTKQLQQQLTGLVYEIEKGDHQTFSQKFSIRRNTLKKVLLFIPSLLAVVLNWPIYLAAKMFTKWLIKNSDHYDAVVFAFLLFFYPVYILLATAAAWLITQNAWSLLLLLIMPLTVLAYVRSHVRKDKSFHI